MTVTLDGLLGHSTAIAILWRYEKALSGGFAFLVFYIAGGNGFFRYSVFQCASLEAANLDCPKWGFALIMPVTHSHSHPIE